MQLQSFFSYVAFTALATNALPTLRDPVDLQQLAEREAIADSQIPSLVPMPRRDAPTKTVDAGLFARDASDELVVRQTTGDPASATPSGAVKDGSVYDADGKRLRAGMLAIQGGTKVVMLNNGASTDWIFPRGGIDDRPGYDEYDAEDPVPAFRRAAHREAFEEAGIKLVVEAPELDYLTSSDKGSEYWYGGVLKELRDEFPERSQGREIIVELFTLAEAKEKLGSNKKKQTLMIEALDEAENKGIITNPPA